ncbi:rod shape-determining protein MreD [Isoalcanivorax beigongshangi]|uniref:Rod shape-determining protein MreD n=1 Tax=Isoalcanivorax beigongshangi TaxID=3238810 RepID=A0ABV4AIM5_9GAMM
MMRPARHSGSIAIALTFLLAAVLELLPLPDWLALGRPEWMTLVLLYWVVALPHRVGVFVGFGVGLFQDVLLGTVLGQHAVALALVAYMVLALHKRLRVFPPLQQSVVIFLLVGLGSLISYMIQNAVGRVLLPPVWVLLPALISALIWRPVFALLRWVRHRFQVR